MKIQSAAKINGVPMILVDGHTYSTATLKTVINAAEAAPAGTAYSIDIDPTDTSSAATPAATTAAPAKS